jgi:hypothetical protein
MKDFLRLYSSLVQRCFDDCANDFTTKSITGKEVRATSAESQRRTNGVILLIGSLREQVCR